MHQRAEVVVPEAEGGETSTKLGSPNRECEKGLKENALEDHRRQRRHRTGRRPTVLRDVGDVAARRSGQ